MADGWIDRLGAISVCVALSACGGGGGGGSGGAATDGAGSAAGGTTGANPDAAGGIATGGAGGTATGAAGGGGSGASTDGSSPFVPVTPTTGPLAGIALRVETTAAPQVPVAQMLARLQTGPVSYLLTGVDAAGRSVTVESSVQPIGTLAIDGETASASNARTFWSTQGLPANDRLDHATRFYQADPFVPDAAQVAGRDRVEIVTAYVAAPTFAGPGSAGPWIATDGWIARDRAVSTVGSWSVEPHSAGMAWVCQQQRQPGTDAGGAATIVAALTECVLTDTAGQALAYRVRWTEAGQAIELR